MSRSYEVAAREGTGEPITFDMVHVEVDPATGEQQKVTTTFTCRGELEPMMLIEMSRHADETGFTPQTLALIGDFLAQVFGDPAEHRRFNLYCHQQRVDYELLVQVMQDLVEDFTNRPFEVSEGSSTSLSSGGPTSKADSPRQGPGFTVVEGLSQLDEVMASSA